MNIVNIDEVIYPAGFKDTLEGLTIEEQILRFRICEEIDGEQSFFFWKDRRETDGEHYCRLDQDSDVYAVVVSDGLIVGVLMQDFFEKEYFCEPEQTVLSYCASDNNGAGYKEREDYKRLVCVSSDFEREILESDFKKYRKKYNCVERKKVQTIGELQKFVDSVDAGKLFMEERHKNSLDDTTYWGMGVRLGNYERKMEEFTDEFDFPDGFYSEEIFIPADKEAELCLELFLADENEIYNSAEQTVLKTITQLKEYLEQLIAEKGEEIPVLSVDDNYELKGSLTRDTYLEIYKEVETGKFEASSKRG